MPMIARIICDKCGDYYLTGQRHACKAAVTHPTDAASPLSDAETDEVFGILRANRDAPDHQKTGITFEWLRLLKAKMDALRRELDEVKKSANILNAMWKDAETEIVEQKARAEAAEAEAERDDCRESVRGEDGM